jgi:hypothetical protein
MVVIDCCHEEKKWELKYLGLKVEGNGFRNASISLALLSQVTLPLLFALIFHVLNCLELTSPHYRFEFPRVEFSSSNDKFYFIMHNFC